MHLALRGLSTAEEEASERITLANLKQDRERAAKPVGAAPAPEPEERPVTITITRGTERTQYTVGKAADKN